MSARPRDASVRQRVRDPRVGFGAEAIRIARELRPTVETFADTLVTGDEARLAGLIYERLHLRRRACGSERGAGSGRVRVGRRFAAALRSVRYRADGFEVHGEPPLVAGGHGHGTLSSERPVVAVGRASGLRVLVRERDIARRRGTELSLWLPVLRERPRPGFVGAVGRAGPVADGAALWRIYCSVPQDRADDAALALWGALSSAGIRFQLKLLALADEYPRADALVAYVASDDLPRAADLAVALGRAGLFSEPAAGLARPLGNGVAVAPEPLAAGCEESYGTHVAAVAARTLLSVVTDGRATQIDEATVASALGAELAALANATLPQSSERGTLGDVTTGVQVARVARARGSSCRAAPFASMAEHGRPAERGGVR